MIVDGHAHASGNYGTAGSIVATLDAAGVHQVVLCPGDSTGSSDFWLPDLASRLRQRDLLHAVNGVVRVAVTLTGKARNIIPGNEAVFRLQQTCPQRIRQCYWLDPRPKEAMAVLDRRFGDWRFCMVKLHQCWTPFAPSDPVIEGVAAWCGDRELPLFVHLYRRRDIPPFLELCQRHSRTRFILGHLIGAGHVAARALRLPNLYWDTSPPQLVGGERILAAVRHFGSERVLLGSDTPYGRGNLRRAIQRVDRLPLTSREKEVILGDNLAAMLGPPCCTASRTG